MKQKALFRLLSLLLCISMLPITVFAEDTLIANGSCGTSLTWKLDASGTLTIRGSGSMRDYNSSSTTERWYRYRDSIKRVVIEAGATSIGSYAFYNCKNLESVSIPDTVSSIRDSAFSCCERLTQISIPNSVIFIYNSAFYNCYRLTSMVIPNSVKSISQNAFYNCHSLSSIILSNQLESLAHSIFRGCTSLTSIVIPESVTRIADASFYGCSALQTVDFLGDPPEFLKEPFKNVCATCYYPSDNSKWTNTYFQDYGTGTLTWQCRNHVHSFTTRASGVQVTEATCAKAATYYVQCDFCDVITSAATVSFGNVQHTPADAVRENEVAATCKDAGSYDEVVYCSLCKAEISRTAKALEKLTTHAPANAVHEKVTPPTCTERGYTTYTCDTCGDSYVDHYVDALGHDDFVGWCAVCGTDNVIASLDGNILIVTGEPIEDIRILAACYDGKGQFIEAVFLVWQGNTLCEEIPTGEMVQLFFVDKNCVPLRQFILLN